VVTDAERLTLEQVRRAVDVVIRCIGLPNDFQANSTKRSATESVTINVVMHKRVVAIARNASPTITTSESTPTKSTASSQNPLKTNLNNFKLALSS
jgi:hypothetical protein